RKAFGTLSHNAHRPAGFLGQDHRGWFQFGIELAAKPTAERKHDHAHVSDGHFEDTGELALDNVGILTARPYRDSVIGHLRHDDVGLERDVVNGRRSKSVLDDMIGLAEALSDVTFALFEQVDD